MFKIIFVLVINAYHGGMTTIEFTNLQQCESAREKVQAAKDYIILIKNEQIKKREAKLNEDFKCQYI